MTTSRPGKHRGPHELGFRELRRRCGDPTSQGPRICAWGLATLLGGRARGRRGRRGIDPRNRVIPPRQRGRGVWRRTLLGEISGRIARAKAFANLMSFFGTHVFAIWRRVRALDRWRHLCFAKRHGQRHSSRHCAFPAAHAGLHTPGASVPPGAFPGWTTVWGKLEGAHSWGGGGPGQMGSAVPSR
jgi:hypothetical protein